MALTPAQRPGRMPARRLVWMTGLMFQTRLQENPNPLAFKGRAGGGPLAMPGMRESPRHGCGACRGSDLPPSWGKGGQLQAGGEAPFHKAPGMPGVMLVPGKSPLRQESLVPCLPHDASVSLHPTSELKTPPLPPARFRVFRPRGLIFKFLFHRQEGATLSVFLLLSETGLGRAHRDVSRDWGQTQGPLQQGGGLVAASAFQGLNSPKFLYLRKKHNAGSGGESPPCLGR